MPDAKGQDYYVQVSNSIQSIYELTTRVDERVKLMMQKVEQLEAKLDTQISEYRDLEGRIRVIESNPINPMDDLARVKDDLHKYDLRLRSLEMTTGTNENRWQNIRNFVVQMLWILLAGYFFMKFGFTAPNVP